MRFYDFRAIRGRGEGGEMTRPEISFETRKTTFENLLNDAGRDAIALITIDRFDDLFSSRE